MSKRKDLYQEVTNKVIALLETHQGSWDKSWITLSTDRQPNH